MAERRSILIPLAPEDDRWAVLTATWPLSEAAWEQMLALLAAMRPGLVQQPSPDVEPTTGGQT